MERTFLMIKPDAVQRNLIGEIISRIEKKGLKLVGGKFMQVIGSTNPSEAAPGTIRGDYGLNLGRNIIHGSDSTESAQREVKLWFTSSEIADYKEPREDWLYE